MPDIRTFLGVTVRLGNLRRAKFEFLGHRSQPVRIERNSTVAAGTAACKSAEGGLTGVDGREDVFFPPTNCLRRWKDMVGDEW
jgi:hypothetical protein